MLKHELDKVANRKRSRVIYLTGPSSDPAKPADRQLPCSRLVGALRDHDIYLCASARLAAAVERACSAVAFRDGRTRERFALGP